MFSCKSWFLGLIGVLAAGSVLATEAPVVNYDYTSGSLKVEGTYAAPKVTGKTDIRKEKFGALYLSGNKNFLTVPGSEKFSVENGASFLAFVRYEEAAEYGMIFFKDREFLLGMSKPSQLYFNMIRNGGKWNSYCVSRNFPKGKWIVMAATLEFLKDKKVCAVKVYLDGVMKANAVLKCEKIVNANKPILIGNGWGGVWHLKGAVGAARIYDRTLKSAEIKALSDSYLKLVK